MKIRFHSRKARSLGSRQVSLPAAEPATPERGADVLDLDEALARLGEIDPRKAQLLELRVFAGLTIKETAEALGVSIDTVKQVEEILRRPGEDRPGRKDSRVALGQTHSGRCLRVIHVPDPETNSVFVITAYDLIGEPLKAYRRRCRRR